MDFTHPAPRSSGYLATALGTSAIHFEQQVDAIHYRRPGPSTEPPAYDPYLRQILHSTAQHVIDEARPNRKWLDAFRTSLRTDAADGCGARIDTTAARLGTSGRTLRRRLADAGTCWNDELAAVRREQAELLLRDTTLTVHAVARRTGYSDARALSRAFARWTGLSPDAYRRRHRSFA